MRTRADTFLFTHADFLTINQAVLPSGDDLLRFWGIAQPMLFESYFQGDGFIIMRIPKGGSSGNRGIYKIANRTLTPDAKPYK